MDTAKWPQEFVVKPMNEIVTNTCLKQPPTIPPPPPVDRKSRPDKDQPLNCPRCNSLNTKFCYYNNYSLTQPRYFCKDCRRYWTEGGSLRNIPVGGGIRKNKRSSSSSSSSPSSSSSSKKPTFVNNTPHLNPNKNPHEATTKVQEMGFSQGAEVKDLNLAFSQGFGIAHQSIPDFLQVLPGSMKTNNNDNPSLVSTSSALELLGISTTSRPSFMPTTNYLNAHDSSSVYTAASGFGLSYPHFQEFMRPALGFSLDGGDPQLHHHHHHHHHQEEGSTGTTTNSGSRPLLQFESLKLPVSSSATNSGGNDNHHHNQSDHDHDKEEGDAADHSAGFWNGMLSTGAASSGATGSWQ